VGKTLEKFRTTNFSKVSTVEKNFGKVLSSIAFPKTKFSNFGKFKQT
jgi:hypothetical protein